MPLSPKYVGGRFRPSMCGLALCKWPLHLGHVAGCYLPPDIYARFERSLAVNHASLMVSGSDEHGTPRLPSLRSKVESLRRILSIQIPLAVNTKALTI